MKAGFVISSQTVVRISIFVTSFRVTYLPPLTSNFIPLYVQQQGRIVKGWFFMELSSYFASYFGWVTPDDYFIGGLSVCICIVIFTEFLLSAVNYFFELVARDRREKICQVHHSQQASEPCHFRSCPASRYCGHYQQISFKERIAWAFGIKKRKP